jgi:hypothetical protein
MTVYENGDDHMGYTHTKKSKFLDQMSDGHVIRHARHALYEPVTLYGNKKSRYMHIFKVFSFNSVRGNYASSYY